MAAPKKVDYERIEPGWRAGILSPRQLAAQYTEETGEPCSHAAINNHFKRQNIPRDLSAKIRAKTEAMVSAAIVTANVPKLDSVTEKAIVEGNASHIAGVRLAHRRDIQRARGITMSLFAELELQAGPENVALLAQLGELLASGEGDLPKITDAYQRITSLPSRAKIMKDLGEALRVVVQLERQALGLDSADEPENGGSTMGYTKSMTDAERAVRLSRLINGSPEAAAGLLAALKRAA